MSEIRELYQQVILDHNKSPRNYRRPEGANRTSEGFNPLCGDHLHVFLKVREGVIQDIGFEGSGCAISKASASLMTTALKGLKTDEVEALFRRFHDMVTGDVEQAPDTEGLGKLAVFAGVREFPARVKCASLAWHTMHAALEGKDQPISTE